MLFRLRFQAGHSIVWRDAISEFYFNKSGIPDDAQRVGNHPWRVEAESMQLSGYEVVAVHPFETASNFKAIVTSSNTTAGTATAKLDFASSTLNYYDIIGGQAKYAVYLNDGLVAKWIGDSVDTGRLGHAPSSFLDGHSATRITFPGVKVEKGDTLRIVGTPDGAEPAPLDYVVLLPAGVVD